VAVVVPPLPPFGSPALADEDEALSSRGVSSMLLFARAARRC
jgi:hypothetical protein